ncbi:MAG: FtsX-like permease family protein [Bacteroidota bacterium]
MIFSIAWKNVWRNKLRSLIIILSITLGLLGGIFYLAFSNGMVQQQINGTIQTVISNIQLHNPEYLINNEIIYTIKNPEEKVKTIRQTEGVRAVASKLVSRAMASSAITGTGIVINGIDPIDERETTDLYSKIVEGSYFESDLKNPAVIGKKLAEKLKIKINSKLVVTIQNSSGDIAYGAFRVVGIYKTDNTSYDQMYVFTQKKDLSRLIAVDENTANEISILLKHNDLTKQVTDKLKNIFSEEIDSETLTIRSWDEIQPILKMLNEMTIQFTMIFVIIILVALSFGIINTMLMAVMERVREIGMLMAIGMNKIKVFSMILLETVFLSITGGVIGLALSYIAVEITGNTGIDLSIVAEGLNAWGYSAFIYPELDVIYYFMIGGLVVTTALFASILPARKALKFNPAEAVRHDV